MSIGPNMWLALAGYVCAALAGWRFRQGSVTGSALLLMFTAGLLRTSASLDPTLHEWDERYHALVAKHLSEHPLTPTLFDDPRTPHVVGSWSAGHVWLNKPPLPLWCMALSLKCFGMEPWAVRMPSILLSMCAVGLLFALARSLFSPAVAFWSALLFAINGHLIELASGRTSNDHPDTFLLCMVLASLYAADRMVQRSSPSWAALSGVALGLAFLSKSWPATIVLPVTLLWLWGRKPTERGTTVILLATLVGSATLIALPWTLYVRHAFPEVAQAASASHWQHFTVAIEDHGRPWTYYWEQLPMLHGEIVPLALLLFLLGPFRRAPARHAGLVAWWLIPYLVFSVAITKMPGYVVIAAPAIYLMIAFVMEQWLHVGGRTAKRWFALTGVALLVLLPVRSSLDRIAPWRQAGSRYIIAERWQQVPPNTVVTNCPWPIELMFHTPVVAAYAHELTTTVQEQLRAEGYTVLRYSSN